MARIRERARPAGMLAIWLVLSLVVGNVAVASQATPEATPLAGVPVPPATPAGEQLAWLLEVLNGDPSTLTQDEIETRFVPAFLAQVPVDQLREVLVQFAGGQPWSLVEFVDEPSDTSLKAVVRSPAAGAVLITLVVEPDPPHPFVGLLFGPAPAASWDEVDERVGAVGGQTSFLAAEIVDGRCEPVHAIDAGERLAIGSAFKLYVLGELARQVEAGLVAWDDLLEVRDEWKSLPSGDLRYEPAGTPHTLRFYAELMISDSDNTATDHLIYHLGRENVEAIQAVMGHGDPAVNTPFLTTRELFILKLALSDEERAAYLAASPEERRATLDGEVASAELPSFEDAATFTEPIEIDTIEWFASAEDLCAAMAHLHAQSQQPGLLPVAEILALNPGIPVNRAVWPTLLFKGGSEPGVFNLTFLAVRDDGRVFVVTAGFGNPDADVDPNLAIAAAQSAFDVLATVP